MGNFGLSKVFGSGLASFMNDVFENFDEKITTYFPDYSWMRPDYALKEKDGEYEIAVEYNEDRDRIRVKTDEEKRLLSITVYEDWDKTNGIHACNYYGQYLITVPEDCDLDSLKEEYDEDTKKMTISFDKVKQEKEDEKEYVIETEDEDTIDAKDTSVKVYNVVGDKTQYEALKKKYEREVEYSKKYFDETLALKEKCKELKEENERLSEKLKKIESLFN